MTTAAATPVNWRQRLALWVEGRRAQQFIITLIIINAVILGMETSDWLMTRIGPTLLALDQLILAVFVVEIALRLLAHGWRFFRDPWSLFDFSVVAVALIPASGPLAALRALRVLRVLRLLSMVPSMRRVVGALLSAIPGIGSIFLILLLIFYVFAVIATNLFGATHPQWFGTLGDSMYTLFQIMTLESWSMGIVRPVMEEHPLAWAFFVPFILVATFTMLNLFIAIIVQAMQSHEDALQADTVEHVDSASDRAHSDYELLRREMRELRTLLEQHKKP